MASVTGGNKLAQRLADMARKAGSASSVEVGFGWGDTYPTGEPLALIAAINEYGAPSRGIPPRPFMRITIAAHRSEWPAQLAARFQYHDGDVRAAFADMGEIIKSELQDTVRSNVPPPNAPSVVARKGFSRTLIETGYLLQHIKWAVQ